LQALAVGLAALALAGCGAEPPAAQPLIPVAPAPAAAIRPAAPPKAMEPVPAAGHPVVLNAVTSCGISEFREAVLHEINLMRASGTSCGGKPMRSAASLAWNHALFSAAARHSWDMAQRDYFDHVDPEGRHARQRATAEGYQAREVAENIAGGNGSVHSVMVGWKSSPAHCQIMMEVEFRDIGVACVQRSGTTWENYWTMVLGRRR
jgi:uncharacterized protein YkwD